MTPDERAMVVITRMATALRAGDNPSLRQEIANQIREAVSVDREERAHDAHV